MGTPIMDATEQNYEDVAEVMKRMLKKDAGFDTHENAVHVHVDFPKKENFSKLVSLFARIEPVLSTLNTRNIDGYHKYTNLNTSNTSVAKLVFCTNRKLNPELKENVIDSLPKNGMLRGLTTNYGTAEFRSVIDLTWDPETNVQNVILSQTVAKIANLPQIEFEEIIEEIGEILPIQEILKDSCRMGVTKQNLKRPSQDQTESILSLLERVAKEDALFKISKIQPNFKVLLEKSNETLRIEESNVNSEYFIMKIERELRDLQNLELLLNRELKE